MTNERKKARQPGAKATIDAELAKGAAKGELPHETLKRIGQNRKLPMGLRVQALARAASFFASKQSAAPKKPDEPEPGQVNQFELLRTLCFLAMEFGLEMKMTDRGLGLMRAARMRDQGKDPNDGRNHPLSEKEVENGAALLLIQSFARQLPPDEQAMRSEPMAEVERAPEPDPAVGQDEAANRIAERLRNVPNQFLTTVEIEDIARKQAQKDAETGRVDLPDSGYEYVKIGGLDVKVKRGGHIPSAAEQGLASVRPRVITSRG